MHGFVEWLAPASPDGGKHQRTLLRVSALAAPLFKAEADGLRDSNQAVVSSTKAVLAFDLLCLKLAAPRRVHDLKYQALVGAPGQAKDFAGTQRAERRDQKDGTVA